MIERPRNEGNKSFYDYLKAHGYDEKPFDYVLEQIGLDMESRWPFRSKGPLKREALEWVWGSFNPQGMKRAYEIQNQQKAAARQATVEEDECEVPF